MKRFYLLVFTVFLMLISQSGWAEMMGQGAGGGQPGEVRSQDTGQVNAEGFYCPNCGAPLKQSVPGYGGGAYPGMMGYGSAYPGMGPGMMGYGAGQGVPGYGYGGMMGYGGAYPGMTGYGAGPYPGMMGVYPQRSEPLKEKDVKALVENHLNNFVRNPNIKLGKVKEKGEAFEVEIVTIEGSLVNRFLVDKRTGMMQPAK